MTHAILKIDYDEGVAGSYRAIEVAQPYKGTVFRVASGDPIEDWRTAMNWIIDQDYHGYRLTSSCDHFCHDHPTDYRYVEDEKGIEMLAREDREGS